MKRYILAMLLTDRNTSFLFDSKRAGGLDQLFEQVGAAIAKIGNENVHECKLTEVDHDFQVGADFTPYGQLTPQPTNQDWVVVNACAQTPAQSNIGRGNLFTDQTISLDSLIHPEGAIKTHPARVMSLATMAIRDRVEWAAFFHSNAYDEYIVTLDNPVGSFAHLEQVRAGLLAYHTAMIQYGVSHELLPGSFMQ